MSDNDIRDGEPAAMSNDKMREEFEVWLLEVLNNADMEDITKARAEQDGQSIYLFEDDDEATLCITAMWLAWQASRASLVVDLPETELTGAIGMAHKAVTKRCRTAIEAAGVQVKP